MDAHRARLERARASLEALATGDAFGEQFFRPAESIRALLETRELPIGPWHYTDDTAMAVSIVDVLERWQSIDREGLASLFGVRYRLDPARGYGAAAHDVLGQLAAGVPWREAAQSVFGGGGSMGNGAAMRSAPVGAYFCADLDAVVLQAARSAEVTHAHPEGRAGAVAVALASACVARSVREPGEFFATVLAGTPPSQTRMGIVAAATLPLTSEVSAAVDSLGNGSRVLAQDTVPFSLWCVARHLGRFEEAMWATVSGLGDRDTTCAIVAGILGSDPRVVPPRAWLAAREPLAAMCLEER